jgi:hypothetical protein
MPHAYSSYPLLSGVLGIKICVLSTVSPLTSQGMQLDGMSVFSYDCYRVVFVSYLTHDGN